MLGVEMGKATWDARRTFSPNAWEILFLQEMNQVCPVAQAGRWEIWVCVCVLFTAHHPHSKCTQCALLFDQLLEVWGQGLAVRGGAFSAQERKPDLERQGRELSVEVCWCCCVTLSQGVSLWVCRIKGQRS